MLKQIYAIEEALHASDDPKTWVPHPASHMQGRSREAFRVDNLPHVSAGSPCTPPRRGVHAYGMRTSDRWGCQLCSEFFDFVTHPRIRGFGEEACGGAVSARERPCPLIGPAYLQRALTGATLPGAYRAE
jgi:hypothetical protein